MALLTREPQPREKDIVSHQESTIANTDLWSRYFQEQWSRWLNPLGVQAASPVTQVADGTAARVAGFLTLVAAGPIAWLYSSNEPATMIEREARVGAPLHVAEDLESVEDSAA
jgi:hypothetical protein